MKLRAPFAAAAALLALAALRAPLAADPAPPSPFAGALHWRMIGPFRGGRTVAVAGVRAAPADTIYIGVNDGGVWRTTNWGRTWTPLFDAQPTQSIGALAVAPSDPRTIYAGSGEGLQRPDLSVGNGVYVSHDGGTTWTQGGLRDGQQIGGLAVDPRDPRRVYATVLGHPYGPNQERGVFRSTDGGMTWARVLFRDADTGAIGLALDPAHPDTLYASLWAARQPPWEPFGSSEIPGSGLYKSDDGGTNWRELTAGLPAGRGRIGIAIAPSRTATLYAMVDAPNNTGGVYRSDDAGATWRQTNNERRVWGRGQDFAAVTVDPHDPETIYVANTSTYRSTDGGRTFVALKGAPGGDDYHTVWIDPEDSRIVVLASDQGATISLDRGATWSSWYNQPTAQVYHVTVDDRFPYRVYGGQQESGSAGVQSRGDDGAITLRDWHPAGIEEYGYGAPDPLHPWLIYGGKATVYDERTRQTRDVSPPGEPRYVRTAPIIFSRADPHRLYLGRDVVWETRDGATHWRAISPDLAQPNPAIPPNFSRFAGHELEPPPHRGTVYALAPSPKRADTLWAGTSDGKLSVTTDDGRHWRDVTPPGTSAWSKIAQIDAGRHDAATAYVAVNRFKLDDLHPYVQITHDGGRTWRLAVAGLPPDEPVNAVREDPVRRGLLYAATQRGVYVSWDDGAAWAPLTLDLPHASVRDLVVHDDDLVVATHGRGFWILDDVAALRALAGPALPARATIFPTATAIRWRWNLNTDTPFPPEEPAGENPPDGAILDYALPSGVRTLALEVRDARGTTVRRFTSDDTLATPDPRTLPIPTYWLRPPARPDAGPGFHRFVWDLHEREPRAFRHEYPISAVVRNTPREPRGPLAAPGRYTVRLIVDGAVAGETPLTVRMDPRVDVPAAALLRQHAVAVGVRDAMDRSFDAGKRDVNDRLAQLLSVVDGADGDPSPAVMDAYRAVVRSGIAVLPAWTPVKRHRATAEP